jgi:hypothetical protein
MSVNELPSVPLAAVVDSAPLWVVADMIEAGQYAAVLVLRGEDAVRGLVMAGTVKRLAARLPEAPVRMVPMAPVLEVASATPVAIARLRLDSGACEALVFTSPDGRGWRAVWREHLSVDAPQPAIAALS